MSKQIKVYESLMGASLLLIRSGRTSDNKNIDWPSVQFRNRLFTTSEADVQAYMDNHPMNQANGRADAMFRLLSSRDVFQAQPVIFEAAIAKPGDAVAVADAPVSEAEAIAKATTEALAEAKAAVAANQVGTEPQGVTENEVKQAVNVPGIITVKAAQQFLAEKGVKLRAAMSKAQLIDEAAKAGYRFSDL